MFKPRLAFLAPSLVFLSSIQFGSRGTHYPSALSFRTDSAMASWDHRQFINLITSEHLMAVASRVNPFIHLALHVRILPYITVPHPQETGAHPVAGHNGRDPA